jgi:hypothetical protein
MKVLLLPGRESKCMLFDSLIVALPSNLNIQKFSLDRFSGSSFALQAESVVDLIKEVIIA